MKEYKKMYVVNGSNLTESDFNHIVDFFSNLHFDCELLECEDKNIICNCVTQNVDKFKVIIKTYYFNYFGKFIELGQEVVSFKM